MYPEHSVQSTTSKAYSLIQSPRNQSTPILCMFRVPRTSRQSLISTRPTGRRDRFHRRVADNQRLVLLSSQSLKFAWPTPFGFRFPPFSASNAGPWGQGTIPKAACCQQVLLELSMAGCQAACNSSELGGFDCHELIPQR